MRRTHIEEIKNLQYNVDVNVKNSWNTESSVRELAKVWPTFNAVTHTLLHER
jgi:hypothetical protein